MIKGLACAHCITACAEAWREMPCRGFREDWKKIMEDSDQRIARQGKAQYRRICKKARREASGQQAV